MHCRLFQQTLNMPPGTVCPDSREDGNDHANKKILSLFAFFKKVYYI
jgi:hypothetical protein